MIMMVLQPMAVLGILKLALSRTIVTVAGAKMPGTPDQRIVGAATLTTAASISGFIFFSVSILI